jgi:hypothetical protein
LVLHFASLEEQALDGLLQVMTKAGCAEFDMSAGATAGFTLTYSDVAIDFGNVAPGTTLDRTVTFLHQRAPDHPQSTFHYFGASPRGFTLVGAPEDDYAPASCRPFSFDVRFEAPMDPGPIEGSLGFTIAGETRNGFTNSSRAIALFASVR